MTKCCNLQTILLEALSEVDDDIVCSIAHNLPKLQRLSLRNCRYTDVGICEVAKHCNQLRMLALDGNCSLTDKGVLSLAENCPYLCELYLLGSDRVSQSAVQRIVVSMYLRTIYLHNFTSHSFYSLYSLHYGRTYMGQRCCWAVHKMRYTTHSSRCVESLVVWNVDL